MAATDEAQDPTPRISRIWIWRPARSCQSAHRPNDRARLDVTGPAKEVEPNDLFGRIPLIGMEGINDRARATLHGLLKGSDQPRLDAAWEGCANDA